MVVGACAGSGDGERAEVAPSTSMTVPAAVVEARTDKTVTVAPPGAVVVELVCCRFSPAEVTVRGATPTLFLVNLQTDADVNPSVRPFDLQHDFAIVGPGGLTIAQSERLAIGERAVFTFEGLESGSYDFFCTLLGHAVQGMRGTLQVTDTERMGAAGRLLER